MEFLLSSHVIEHCPNFIKTLIEWYRVLKNNGILYIITPLRDAAPSDRNKPLTTWKHLFDDYKNNQTAEDEPQAGIFGYCHYHVFSIDTFHYFIEEIFQGRLELIDSLHIDDKVGNGFTLVYRKKLNNLESFPWEINNHKNSISIKF
jgi:SAM-dependent methyltransferase